ncbi:hypothetical protein [Rheinheimera nanhaiensis]|uniref:hypothetical protein n=1 Tax=Rheinheimera nanhaiensis TaxID=1163621 RepID=UPI00058B7506|nr:hypothetical protein [Rheinheimera nanhaiensis]
MKSIWFLILFSFGWQVHADICEPKVSEEQEKFIYTNLAQLSFEQQLSFLNFLAITRKRAFEEGALNTLSSIDDEMSVIIHSIITFANSSKYIEKTAVLEALDLFLKGFNYHPLTWTTDSTDSINNKISELRKNV